MLKYFRIKQRCYVIVEVLIFRSIHKASFLLTVMKYIIAPMLLQQMTSMHDFYYLKLIMLSVKQTHVYISWIVLNVEIYLQYQARPVFNCLHQAVIDYQLCPQVLSSN